MPRGIRLLRSVSNYEGITQQGFRIRVEVTEATDISDHIFRYLMGETNPKTGERAGVFDGVCSPVDIEEMPEAEPLPADEPAWFRLPYVDLIVETRAVALDLWEGIREDVSGLIQTYNVMDELTETEEFVIGTL